MALGALLGGLGGLLGGGASLFSGLFGGSKTSGLEDAISSASQMQYQAAMQAMQNMNAQIDIARGYMKPYYEAGTKGLGEYMNYLGLGQQGFDPTAALQATPGYNWMLGQGVEALDRSAAAGSGLFGSGAHRQGLLGFGQNLALTKAYDPYMNRLSGLVGTGLNAGQLSGQWGIQGAQPIGNWLMQGAESAGEGMTSAALANMMGQRQNWNQIMGGLGLMTNTLSNPQFTNALSGLWGKK